MKFYLTAIKYNQQILLGVSMLILLVLPTAVALYPKSINQQLFYTAAHVSLFLVMIIRPLADLLPKIPYVRPLVILRKGLGVFSASIIVSFILAKIIVAPGDYFSSFATTAYWSLEKLALLAHLADISAILLLVTSNNLSKKLLGIHWKQIQRLSYVYFYGSALYLFFIVGDQTVLYYVAIVTFLTIAAFFKNRARRASVNLNPVTI
jgi:DMSO/TMAO reductase YedYZ heme-binding membrane subunit